MKKTVTTLAFLMLVIFLLPIAASAADTGDEKITSDDFAVEISDETSKILESMGIENIDYDSLISASPRKIITCIIDIAKGKLKEPVKTLGIVLSIAVVAAVVGSFAPSKTAEKYSVGTVCSFLIVSALTVPLASTLSSAASSIALTADFMKGYIPVFAGTVAASGMTLTSASYSALELVGGRGGITTFINVFRPINRAHYDGYAFVIHFGQCKFRENNIAFEKDYFDCSRCFINRICGAGHNKGCSCFLRRQRKRKGNKAARRKHHTHSRRSNRRRLYLGSRQS